MKGGLIIKKQTALDAEKVKNELTGNDELELLQLDILADILVAIILYET